DSIRARNAAEDRVRQMEADALQLQARIDDNAFAIAELEQIRDGLQQELGAVSDRHRGDIDDHDRVMDELRAKYQGELEETTAELENIKKDHIELREAYINLDSDLALKAQDLDRANEEAVEAKRELMRVMAKLEELVPAYEEARDTAKQLEEDLAKAKRDLDSAMIRTSEAESLRDEMRTVKEKVEARLDELQDKYIEASRGRQTAEKAALQLEDEVKSARAKLSEINEDQTSAEDRVTRLDAVVADAHLALDKEREANTLLTKEKNNLEKQIKGLKLRIVELEAEAVAFQAKGNKRFQPVPADLASKLEAQAKVSLEDQQKLKQMERQIRELQFQIGEKDMSKQRNEMDMQRMTNRVKRLEEQIRELEETEQQLTVAKHRLERELGSLRSRNGSRNGTPNSFN
ncbi:class II myosin, partial [Linderina macrospora]